MRTLLGLLIACLAISCGGHDTPPATQEDLALERKYKEWAAQQPRPSSKLVNHIEAVLANEPCVGKLDRWSRSYAFNRLPAKTVDTGIVDFYLETGRGDVKVGRHITEPDSWVNLDDRDIVIVAGDYDVKEDRIRIGFCGNNLGGALDPVLDNEIAYFDELKRRRSAHRM
jgi:hypothetical protein